MLDHEQLHAETIVIQPIITTCTHSIRLGPQHLTLPFLSHTNKGAKIVDTTGAGDAFIAGFTFGLLHKYPLAKSLALASFVACRKLTAAGARAGLPHRDQVDPRLLPMM